MESNYVSVFKLDGVPILPPLVSDEVRAEVAFYRQKAIEIEKRLQERRMTFAVNNIVVSQQGDENGSTNRVDEESTLDEEKPLQSALSEGTDEAETVESVTIAPTEKAVDNASSMVSFLERSPSEVYHGSFQHEIVDTLETNQKEEKDSVTCNSISNQSQQSFLEQPSWQSRTRTVTPTSEEGLPWFPLVRSNTFNLEKPSIDLKNLHIVDHSTPNEHPPVDRVVEFDQNKPIESAHNVFAVKANTTPVKQNRLTPIGLSIAQRKNQRTGERKKPEIDMLKCRPKRRTVPRTINHTSALSGRAFDIVAQALTTHEQRTMELLKRQEEERLMLEKSFREKTQELVALCAKSLTVEEGNDKLPAKGESTLNTTDLMIVRTKTPDMHTASSISQLSLCDVSYDSCSDTDDAAYQTCQANGTSEENVNNSEDTLTEDQSHNKDFVPTVHPSFRTPKPSKDNNGNEHYRLLPQRMLELQQHKAATIINAYARGYLTRRLFRTEEVQSIKRTIADIVCFIISLQSEGTGRKKDTNQAAVALRRDAGKHIALCLDRLHDIFVNCTTRERLHMIRRDRCLTRKPTLPKDGQPKNA